MKNILDFEHKLEQEIISQTLVTIFTFVLVLPASVPQFKH
jgi:hypothetical protein